MKPKFVAPTVLICLSVDAKQNNKSVQILTNLFCHQFASNLQCKSNIIVQVLRWPEVKNTNTNSKWNEKNILRETCLKTTP